MSSMLNGLRSEYQSAGNNESNLFILCRLVPNDPRIGTGLGPGGITGLIGTVILNCVPFFPAPFNLFKIFSGTVAMSKTAFLMRSKHVP